MELFDCLIGGWTLCWSVCLPEKVWEKDKKKKQQRGRLSMCLCVCVHHYANTMGLEAPRHLMNVCLSFRPHTPLFIWTWDSVPELFYSPCVCHLTRAPLGWPLHQSAPHKKEGNISRADGNDRQTNLSSCLWTQCSSPLLLILHYEAGW